MATESEKRVRDRQAGDYQPPVLREPAGGPIPEWRPVGDDSQTSGPETGPA